MGTGKFVIVGAGKIPTVEEMLREQISDLKQRISELEQANRWVDIKEEIPENDIDILVQISNGRFQVGYKIKDSFEISVQGLVIPFSDIVKWKPITP